MLHHHSHPFGAGPHPDLFGRARHLMMRFAPHLVHHAMGRGHGGGFWGGRDDDAFGPGGPGGFDEEGWRRGRKFSADDLQLLLLSLLEEKPSHGYELIKALETRTNGFYKPSPGVVYPALTYLEEVGYATVDTEGNKKRYQLSETGKAHLAANRERVDGMVARLRHVARKMEWMRRAMRGEQQPEPEQGGWLPELMQARAALKQALVMRSEASADEQRRIAAILARAVAEIEAGPQA
ncbi:putative transcriptional regulator, PadR-like family [Cupriavidus taiwanensis]|uniref:Transcriptional regulator, PadR-like family n=1 Tax=Cupriavidus taiwanensis TaxID=164546 RepID=A0A976G3W8_9BURK|nr:PadR family transcriptional regulator [Cupriavidus taiwanensis]SOZ63390.1 putative transcriptional regulator, PadR-like family [Cupriavidus taiwanensis]SOZ64390.1 putative transcriptional regulator, PadR-like family [Cupriavidus taiwanensis]SOZ68126.1 putative transcriptional regulator, PadR-like family [Cupriavidus taiwanensis]SPA07938.1 putative transcriptional regulator, PadR-like family [Cupriavidus taiwanensis]